MMYFNNPTPAVANPLAESIADGERIIRDLADASTRLQNAIAQERRMFGSLKEFEAMYTDAESEFVSEAVVQAAADKTGPLANIATTSKAYDYALTNLKASLRNGLLKDEWQDLDTRRLQYEQAGIERSQAETEFSGLKRIAELKTAILRAAAL